MERFYDKHNNRLVFVGEKSDAVFWDNHWEVNCSKDQIPAFSKRSLVVKVTKKHIRPEDGPILEGGCGAGQHVSALTMCGFKCIGIDYAQKTVAKVNELIPELDVRYDDVRELDFEDSVFAGYWSLGVIEHFWNGYSEILLEIRRVLKQGGYLFLTFPYLSPLRIFKTKFGFYPLFDNKSPDNFYQFAFDYKMVIEELEGSGFVLKHKKPTSGIKGFKDEIIYVNNRLQQLYDYKGKSILLRGLRYFLDRTLSLFAGHTMLVVLQLERQT